jgi:hypothetical protein
MKRTTLAAMFGIGLMLVASSGAGAQPGSLTEEQMRD